jgi:hypothetical protein
LKHKWSTIPIVRCVHVGLLDIIAISLGIDMFLGIEALLNKMPINNRLKFGCDMINQDDPIVPLAIMLLQIKKEGKKNR